MDELWALREQLATARRQNGELAVEVARLREEREKFPLAIGNPAQELVKLWRAQDPSSQRATVEHLRDISAALVPEPAAAREALVLADLIDKLRERVKELEAQREPLWPHGTVYILCEDSDRTLRSAPWPTGDILLGEDAAKAWVAEDKNNRVYYSAKIE